MYIIEGKKIYDMKKKKILYDRQLRVGSLKMGLITL
jgi:hypothetical protein